MKFDVFGNVMKHCLKCLIIIYNIVIFSRLDYQPLFGKMSPLSSPEGTAGCVNLALLISTNEKRACMNLAGINYLSWMQRVV